MNDDDRSHAQLAREYLVSELGPSAPGELAPAATFDESPLAGEGATTVFCFNTSIGGNPEASFYVVAGQTVPNYYPQWGLDPDQIYSVHLGTRFMLVAEVRQAALGDLPPDLEDQLRIELGGIVPGEELSDFRPVAAFTVEDQKHAVGRARIGPEEVYILCGDLPLGLYRQIELPAHAVYRWHLGNVIRIEREDDG